MATLFPVVQQFFDDNGDPLNGGKVYFYEAGTSTPKDTYTTQAASVANANPVVLDSAGRASIWGRGSYKVVIKTSADVEIDTFDNVNVDSDVVGGSNNTISSTGDNNAIMGGSGNTISSTASESVIIGGQNNTIDGGIAGSVCLAGESNSISANYAVAMGGLGITIASTGDYSFGYGADHSLSGIASYASGYRAKADKYCQRAFASGSFSAIGDAQTSELVLRKSTTNSTPAEMFLDNSSARMTIPTDTTWGFDIMVIARRTDADNEGAFYRFEGAIDNNAGTTALLASVVAATPIEDDSNYACAVTADDTNDALIITVTGVNSKTINWVAYVRLVEVTG